MSTSLVGEVIEEAFEYRARDEERIAAVRCDERIREAVRQYLKGSKNEAISSEGMAQLAAYLVLKSHSGNGLAKTYQSGSLSADVADWINAGAHVVIRKITERRRRLAEQLIAPVLSK
jgi:hypothetical protein